MKLKPEIGLLVVSLAIIGCWRRSVLKPGQICTDEMRALLISQGPNSETEQMQTYHPIDHHGAIHRCGRKSVVGIFYQEVYQYRTVQDAQDEYERQLTVFFSRNNTYIGQWDEPDLVNHLTLSADEYRIACVQRSTDTTYCGMLARYDDTIVSLFVNRTMSAMSLSDFQSAVESADAMFD